MYVSQRRTRTSTTPRTGRKQALGHLYFAGFAFRAPASIRTSDRCLLGHIGRCVADQIEKFPIAAWASRAPETRFDAFRDSCPMPHIADFVPSPLICFLLCRFLSLAVANHRHAVLRALTVRVGLPRFALTPDGVPTPSNFVYSSAQLCRGI